jgi:hypothetical protein
MSSLGENANLCSLQKRNLNGHCLGICNFIFGSDLIDRLFRSLAAQEVQVDAADACFRDGGGGDLGGHDLFGLALQLVDHHGQRPALLGRVGDEAHPAAELDAGEQVVAAPLHVAAVDERLAPDAVVGLEYIYLLPLVSAMEIDGVALFVVAVAEGHEVRLVVAAHGHGHVLCFRQYRLQLVYILDLLLLPAQSMIRFHAVSLLWLCESFEKMHFSEKAARKQADPLA